MHRLDTFVAWLVAPFPMIPAEYDTKKRRRKEREHKSLQHMYIVYI